MRRAAAVVALALALTGCASPQADLQDQIAEVTAVANDGDVQGLLAQAKELELLVDRLEESDELTAAEATGFRNAAVALQQRAGQVRPAPSPVPEPSPEPEETEEPPPPPSPEPEETEEEEEPSPSPEPEETEEPEPSPEPTDGGLVPLPSSEQTQASGQPGQQPGQQPASPVAAASPQPQPTQPSPATASRARRSPSPSATPTAQATPA